MYGFADGDPVNFADPFGLCPWCPFVYAGAEGGAVVGTAVLPGVGTAAGAILGGTIGLVGGLVIGDWLANEASEAESSEGGVSGGKSAEEYDKHQAGRDQARKQVDGLKKTLDQTKGPKARKPIEEKIKRIEKEIKGHDKEIQQKWPNGRPTAAVTQPALDTPREWNGSAMWQSGLKTRIEFAV